MNRKIGVGVITCNRENLFKQCITSLPSIDEVIIINDGKPYDPTTYPAWIKEIRQHRWNKGVGRSKNEALRYLMARGCTDLFLIEDDIKIIREDIFDVYIRAAETTGILHFNYAYHGPANKTQDGLPNPRKVITYHNGVQIGLHKLLGAALSYFKREVIEQCGYFNPLYKNANEHVAHTYSIIKSGYHTPFWWFADLANSYEYIADLDPDLTKSVIRKKKKLLDFRIRLYSHIFHWHFGYHIGDIPELTESETDEILKILTNKHGSK